MNDTLFKYLTTPKPVVLTTEQIATLATQIPPPVVDLTGCVKIVSGKSLVDDTLIGQIHLPGSDNQDLSGLQSKETGKGLSANDFTTEEKSKLSGLVNYIAPAFNSVYRTLLDSSGSHIAARAAGRYGIAQGQPLAITGVGTLYALNTIYIASADYPTIDGKATVLRVRCVIACNDVAPFTGTFTVGLHPVTRPATSGGAGLCIYTIGTAVTGSTVVGTNLVGADFALPADGFYVLGVVTSAVMATSSHCHISASLQIRNN
jgi:hypothetical protein